MILEQFVSPLVSIGPGQTSPLLCDNRGRLLVNTTGDPTATPTGGQSATATTSAVADSAASVQLLAANTSRKGATITNDSTAVLFVKCGTTATTTDYTVQVNSGQYWECPFSYTGRIDGIWATDPNTGAARITEFT